MWTYLLIVSVLLLECATVLFMTTDATLDIALHEAYSKFNSSYNALKTELSFLSSQDFTTSDYLAFILKHRLGMFSYFSPVSYILIFI